MGGRSKLFTLFALHNWSSPAIQGLNFKYSEFKNHLKIHDDPALTSFFSKKCSESNRNPIIVDLAHMKDYITRCIYSCKVVAALLELHVYCRVSNPPDSFGRLQEREWQVEQGGVGRHLEVMERSSNRINVTNHVTSHNASGPRIGASSPKNGLRMKNFRGTILWFARHMAFGLTFVGAVTSLVFLHLVNTCLSVQKALFNENRHLKWHIHMPSLHMWFLHPISISLSLSQCICDTYIFLMHIPRFPIFFRNRQLSLLHSAWIHRS